MTRMVNNDAAMRAQLESRYKGARANLLLAIAFTAINMILLAFGGNSYFLFSISVPYILMALGMSLTGMFPPEAYEGVGDFVPLDKSFFVVMLIIALITLCGYVLCWLLSSKNRVGFLIGGLVLFAIDTAAMFWYYGFSVESILDILFHVWVVYYLVVGIMAYYKLKKLPMPIENVDFEIADQTPLTDVAPELGNAEETAADTKDGE